MTELIHIGTSGYQYDHWQGVFYPQGTAQKNLFQYYAKYFATVEINNTFYNVPNPETFEQWQQQAPPGFCYALKYSRYGTHMKRLKNTESHTAYFLDRAEQLGNTLGPILVQLRPKWKKDPQRLEDFLKTVPKKRRWAVEVRDPDWFCEEVYQVLRQYNSPLVIHDMIADHPRVITANWIYLRFHGVEYGGSYSDQQLDEIAEHIKEHEANQREVFAYFNNDAAGHAVRNALKLKEKVE